MHRVESNSSTKFVKNNAAIPPFKSNHFFKKTFIYFLKDFKLMFRVRRREKERETSM